MRCSSCGAELAPEDQVCGRCGAPRPARPAQFAEAERRFAALRTRYMAGELDRESYGTQLRELMIRDSSGSWIPGADTGAWYWYDGRQWVRRDPPGAEAQMGASQPMPVSGTSPSPFTTSSWRWIVWPIVGLLVACIASAVVLLMATSRGQIIRASIAIALNPRSERLYRLRGAAYAELSQYEQAVADYNRAIQLSPNDTWLHIRRSALYEALNRPGEALVDINRAVQLEPDTCYWYLRRAELSQQLGDVEHALADYRKVLSFDTNQCTLHDEAREALALLGAPEIATPPAGTVPTPEQVLLYQTDFSAEREPLIGEAGEARWERGALYLSVAQPGKSVTVSFPDYSVGDFYLQITAQPITLDPGSLYGLKVRLDAVSPQPGGYWFLVRGDGTCRVCQGSAAETLDCMTDWVECGASPDRANQLRIEAAGSLLTFAVNGRPRATVTDGTYAGGIIALVVSNSEGTAETVVAFDDLLIYGLD